MTYEEYKKSLSEFVALSKEPDAFVKGSGTSIRLSEIRSQTKQFEAENPKWQIVCIKDDVYVGQGLEFHKGDVCHTFWDEAEAREKLERMNKDSWNPNAWELVKVQ